MITIISGDNGSGKTRKAQELTQNKPHVLFYGFVSGKDIEKIQFSKTVVVEEVPNKKAVSNVEKLQKENPDFDFIICTQDKELKLKNAEYIKL